MNEESRNITKMIHDIIFMYDCEGISCSNCGIRYDDGTMSVCIADILTERMEKK